MPQLPQLVHQALERGALVLTPSDRSARALRAEHDRLQQNATWQSANVLPIGTWLRTLWSGLITEGDESRLLLNSAQEHLVWCEVIQTGPAFESMGTLDSLATLTASAWSRATAYGLTTADLQRAASTHDARLFAAWAKAFVALCEQQEYLSTAELPQALTQHALDATLRPPPEILMYGFAPTGSELATEALSPTRAALLDALGERGTNITHIPAAITGTSNAVAKPCHPERSAAGPKDPDTLDTTTTSNTTQPQTSRAVVAAADPQAELRTVIRWIRSFIEQRAAAKLSHNVALLVPTLDDEAAALDATLREILAPELQLISADISSAPYAIASTTSLAATPMIATALDLLRWSAGALPFATVSALLLSPYTAPLETLSARAAFDAFTLRATSLLRPELDLDTLLKLATTTRSKRSPVTPEVRDILHAWHAALHPLTTARKQSYAAWTEALRTALRNAGWPGNRPLTAAEFALTRAWDHVLDLVATLDFAPSRVDLPTALAAIERAAQQAPAAQPDTDAPVQVITPAEAAGCTFDAVIFLRATDTNWPRPERPSPLIGYSLQRERRMPGANIGLSQARAQQLTAQIAASAEMFLAFFAERNAEGEQRLSPLIAQLGLPELEPTSVVAPEAPLELVHEDQIEDTAPIPPLPPGQTRGGATVLELQAACAFHAFAALRLNANAPESTQIGFDARELGTFLHRSLDNFWSDVRSQAALRALTYDQRRTKLERAIAAAAESHPPALTAWDAAYLALQKTRMADVLMQWLNEELKRGPFEVIDREKDRELQVGPLTLKVRLDRVDAVDGGTLLVDYKTGRAGSTEDWQSDRPDAPQLPLYALLPESDDLQGLAFAKVRVGKEMKWQGHSPPGILPRPAPMPAATWDEQREQWRQTLDQLAQDFYDGDASVSPKDYPTTCTHCAHRLLCRVSGPTLAAAAEADDTAVAEHDND